MSNKMEFIKKFRKNFTSFEEIWLFIQIFFLVTVLPFLLKFSSISMLMKMLTPRVLKDYENLDLEKPKEKIAVFTNYILSRNFWIYRGSCLKRSLVLYYLLRKYGIDIQICLGIKYDEELSDSGVKERKLDGHAWLPYNGDIFPERDSETTKTYKMTYCYPERPGRGNAAGYGDKTHSKLTVSFDEQSC